MTVYSPLPFATLPEWFEHQVRATPDSVAVIVDDPGTSREVTYTELNRRANQLARRLEKLNVGPDTVVAICLERSLELIVGLLAILKAGGAYLPIDHELPLERQAFMLKDARPVAVLTQESLRANLPSGDAPVLLCETGSPELDENDADVPLRITGENLAHVIYTSGSTGTPKGVEIPHRAVVNLLASVQKWPGLNAEDILVAITTVSFDIAGAEIFLPLVTGARFVFLSKNDASDGFRILHHLEHHQATVFQATPSTWRMLLEAKWAGNPRLKMICTGEALPRDLADALLPRGSELWNMYGPTETTIWSSGGKVAPSPALVTIGRAIANTQLHILDSRLQPVPPGVSGELHIGGLGLARGYRNRPELTAEKFIPDPFSPEPGARLYKTGDVARVRAGGEIEVLGRMDHQVKIRGNRIELGEIETRLREHPAIKEAVVVAHEASPGHKQLAAYLVLRPEAETASDWRGFLERTLPAYMIPSFFIPLTALPLTPNGKIDRKGLPAPRINHVRVGRPYVAPRGPVETKLAEIWSEVLGRAQVGIDDDIFEIGGDSLLIFRIAARANEAALPLTVRQFFQHRTISALAAQIGNVETSSGPALVAVPRQAFRRAAPPEKTHA